MTQSNILFLDFDGPLYSSRALLLAENQGHVAQKQCNKLNLYVHANYWKMDPIAVDMLNNLYNNTTSYHLVISSSWSHPHLHDKDTIENLLSVNGIQAPLHQDWRTEKNSKLRVEQISNWLKSHPHINNYLILDDIESGLELADDEVLEEYDIHHSVVTLVSIDDGISMKNYEKMRHVMSSW